MRKAIKRDWVTYRKRFTSCSYLGRPNTLKMHIPCRVSLGVNNTLVTILIGSLKSPISKLMLEDIEEEEFNSFTTSAS